MNSSTIELIRYWELERISGEKRHHSPLFSERAISGLLASLLADEGMELGAIDAFWGTPGISPLARDIQAPPGGESFALHSLSHLFSGLLSDSKVFKSATIVAIAADGAPDLTLERRAPPHWYVGAVASLGQIGYAPVESPAPLYGAARFLFGAEPGVLMALASACEAAVAVDVDHSLESISLFGGPQHPLVLAIPFVDSLRKRAHASLGPGVPDPRFTAEENVASAVMKVIQECSERIMERNVRRLCERFAIDPSTAYLSTTGGFALNCPINSHLIAKFGFRGLLSPPCVNDSGQALGLGLMALYSGGVFDRADFLLDKACAGRLPRSDRALRDFAPFIESVTEYEPAIFVDDIRRQPVAWVDGPAEIGPRALGHRSLLGDPTTIRTKRTLNDWRQREWWRPVAPVVLADEAAQWVDLNRPSPFMLEIASVRERCRGLVPAVVHLDGSARLQTLEERDNPLLYGAIEAFRSETGIPLLCNTSLNGRGEPIADSASDALWFCLARGVRVVYLEGRRVSLRSLVVRDREHFRQRPGAEWFRDGEGARMAWHNWSATGLTPEAVFLLSDSPDLRRRPLTTTTVRELNHAAHSRRISDVAFGRRCERFVRLYGAVG